MILNYVWKSDIDTSFATNLWFVDSYRLKRCRWMAYHMPSRQWWAAGKWDDSCKKENKSGTFASFTEKRRRDQWKINDSFLSERYIRSESILLSAIFPPVLLLYTRLLKKRERERERKNKIYRVSVRNCKIRDVIFMSFLPRLRGWLNYEFFLISIRYV